jgi:hypothetical protein
MSDRYIPRIKSIVGPRLLSVTPDEIDCKQAADLMIFAARDMRIAARVRRPGFAAKYAYQFTIRSLRDSGAETELSKIMAGWGDWFFYGHAAGHLDEIPLWWLIDLGEFRSAMIDPTGLVHGVTPNGDGTHFAWFDVRSPAVRFRKGKAGALTRQPALDFRIRRQVRYPLAEF